MKLKKNQGFTLIEMIVVIAVTGIFFTISGLILSSSMNMFGKNNDQSGNFSDTVLVESVIHKFIADVNSQGFSVTIDETNEAKTLTTKNKNDTTWYELQIENDKIVCSHAVNGKIEKDEYEYSSITIEINKTNSKKNIQVYFIEKETNKKTRENIYLIIGGVS